MTTAGLVYARAGADAVEIRRDVEFTAADGGALTMDVYYPSGLPNAALLKPNSGTPAVVVVEGYNDVGFLRLFGCRYKDMVSVDALGRLIASSGMVAIAYSNREPVGDVHAVLRHVREHAVAMGIDGNRIGLWACSGHGPLALSVLMSDARAFVKCAALLYPYLMDLDGATAVADAAATFRFANACDGKSMDDVPADRPFFIARAGQDQMPRLNEALDRFVASALSANRALSLVNHATGPHAFDLFDDSEASRQVIRRTLGFLRLQLLG